MNLQALPGIIGVSNNQYSGIRIGDNTTQPLNIIFSLEWKIWDILWRKCFRAARGNQCSDNSLSGILVTENAAPSLTDNVCQDNGEAGSATRITRPAQRLTTPPRQSMGILVSQRLTHN